MALDSWTLRRSILEESESSLEDSTAFSFIGDEFAEVLKGTRGLRNLCNKKKLSDVRGDEPHDLSEVLSGALYSVMVYIHEKLKAKYSKARDRAKLAYPRSSTSGMTLWAAARRLKRMVFRALDYLPPGEISFVDYGRALIAVDEVAYLEDADKIRDRICEEFTSRCIVSSKSELELTAKFDDEFDEALKDIDVPTLHRSDYAAYEFSRKPKIRQLLCIPPDIRFEVRPRLHVIKKYDHNNVGQECIFKVSWEHEEDNPIGSGYPRKRRITVGTTLVLGWEDGKGLALLTSSYLDARQRYDRDMFLSRLAQEEILGVGRHAIGTDEQPLLSAVQATVADGVMRVRRTGKMLHIIGKVQQT